MVGWLLRLLLLLSLVVDGLHPAALSPTDSNGNRVKATFGSTTTVYVGNTYERDNGSTVRKYYYAGGARMAMRSGGQTYYLLGDHLGGTNVTANGIDGGFLGRVLYKPWGETRFTTGTTPTTWRFTGQREDATIGLYYFNARYLDPQLGRFTQPDTIVPEPGNPQALNRYSYVTNRPTILVDPTGHVGVCFYDGPAAGDADPNDTSTTTQLCSALGEEKLLGRRWRTFNNRTKDVQEAYDFILTVLATAKPGEPVVIVGYSWGGGAALELAKMLNEAGDSPVTVDTLVTIDPVTNLRDLEPTVMGFDILDAVIGTRKSPYNTSDVSDNVMQAINVYAGSQDFPTSEGIENLQRALNVEGSNPEGGEATHFSLMNVERGDLNPRTSDQITRLMQRPWLPLNFR